MPTVLRISGFAFNFYASDRDEPPHVHVHRGGAMAKFWLEPIELERSSGFRRHELRLLSRIIRDYKRQLLDEWYDFFRAE